MNYQENEKHRQEIADRAKADDATFVQCGLFVLLTIQQAFSTVDAQLADVAEYGDDSKHLWGWKQEGYQFLRNNGERLRSLIISAYNRGDVVDAIDTLMEVPGLGTIKAAFFAQLLGFNTGCIDRHNAILYGIDVNAFKIPVGQKARTRLAKISAYSELCLKLGGSVPLWDDWCDYVALLYPKKYANGTEVSAAHLSAVRTQ